MASGKAQAAFCLWLDCGDIQVGGCDLPSQSSACTEVPRGLTTGMPGGTSCNGLGRIEVYGIWLLSGT